MKKIFSGNLLIIIITVVVLLQSTVLWYCTISSTSVLLVQLTVTVLLLLRLVSGGRHAAVTDIESSVSLTVYCRVQFYCYCSTITKTKTEKQHSESIQLQTSSNFGPVAIPALAFAMWRGAVGQWALPKMGATEWTPNRYLFQKISNHESKLGTVLFSFGGHRGQVSD